jgi:hypothetical protein
MGGDVARMRERRSGYTLLEDPAVDGKIILN